MWKRADQERAEFQCSVCGQQLGTDPWVGKHPYARTKCGCIGPEQKKGQQEMITKPSQSEKIQSILDAREPVAAFLQSIGKLDAFNGFTKDEICGLIRAAHDGVQHSLRTQMGSTFEDEIAF